MSCVKTKNAVKEGCMERMLFRRVAPSDQILELQSCEKDPNRWQTVFIVDGA
jgi:hypothetical protein